MIADANAAADDAKSYDTIAVKADILLTSRVQWIAPSYGTRSLVGVWLGADKELQVTISGRNTFNLLFIGAEVEMTVENLVFTGGEALEDLGFNVSSLEAYIHIWSYF